MKTTWDRMTPEQQQRAIEVTEREDREFARMIADVQEIQRKDRERREAKKESA